MKQFLEKHGWGHSIYTAYLDLGGDFKDFRSLTTGVACVCFNEKDQVVLMNNAPKEFKDRYPQLSYILFFLAKGNKVTEPYGSDEKSRQILGIPETLSSGEIKHKILREGIKLYPKYF